MAATGGRKGRKVGKGIYKLSHSKWGSYAGLMAAQASRRVGTMGRRFCKRCSTQFHSRGVLRRHNCDKILARKSKRQKESEVAK